MVCQTPLGTGVATKREFTADIKTALNKAIGEFNEVFQPTPGAKA